MLRKFLLVSLLAVLWCGTSFGTTYTCGTNGVDNSCSSSSLASLIFSASSGDTIQIASGVHTWSADQSVTINKALIITGGGSCSGCGTASPNGSWPATISVSVNSSPAFRISSSNTTDNIRITGLRITGTAVGGTSTLSPLRVETNNASPYVRVDNCKFENTGNSYSNQASGLGGLVDHNWFQANGCNSNAAIMLRDFRNGHGGWPWTQDLQWGSDDFLFIEDNTFSSTCASNDAWLYLWVQGGGQWVLRHNYIQGRYAKVYGCYASDFRSGVAFEAYNNVIYMPNTTNEKAFQVEGGSALIYNNTVTGYSRLVNLAEQRIGSSQGDFGQCNGTSPWDGNLGGSYPAGYPCLDQIGRGKAASADYKTAPYAQPEESRPARIWNNTHNNYGGTWLGDVGAGANYVVENRDYYVCADASCSWVTSFLQSYRPYNYPHPLNGGDVVRPDAPKNPRPLVP